MKRFIIFFILTLFITHGVFAQKTGNKEKEIKPALLVMDIQNQYLPMMDKEEMDLALEYINAYIALFREYGYPVIRIYHTDKERGPHPDSLGFQFPENINILDSDPRVVKNYPSAFTKTDLQKILDEEGCNTIFICGISAVGCALATYMAANDYEYYAFFIKNGIASHNAEYTDYIEEIFGAVSYKITKVLLESTK